MEVGLGLGNFVASFNFTSSSCLHNLLHTLHCHSSSAIMCRECEDPGNAGCDTSVMLIWAVPVDFTTLGARIQAYLSLKPKITQLLLCNHSRRGPNVFIHKLPRELIDMISDFLLRRALKKHEKTWQGFQQCGEYRCSGYGYTEDRDHFTKKELEEIRDEAVWNAQFNFAGMKGCDPEDIAPESIDVDIIDDVYGQKVWSLLYWPGFASTNYASEAVKLWQGNLRCS